MVSSFCRQRDFEPATGSNPNHVAVEDVAGDDSWMNGRLAELITVLRFEAAPVECSENLIDGSNAMIGRYDVVK